MKNNSWKYWLTGAHPVIQQSFISPTTALNIKKLCNSTLVVVGPDMQWQFNMVLTHEPGELQWIIMPSFYLLLCEKHRAGYATD
jgi:hypothetical protein